jgi:hypothetical protein
MRASTDLAKTGRWAGPITVIATLAGVLGSFLQKRGQEFDDKHGTAWSANASFRRA